MSEPTTAAGLILQMGRITMSFVFSFMALYFWMKDDYKKATFYVGLAILFRIT